MATRRFALINSPVEEEQIVNGSTYARLADNETITGDWTFTGSIDVSSASFTGLSSDDLSDVNSIAMLDENETVTGQYTFEDRMTVDGDLDFSNVLTSPNPTGLPALSRTMAGLELRGGAMNTTAQYTSALKFLSTDGSFTTENPKFLGAIVGRAAEGFFNDLDGGMAVDIFGTPNNPGATTLPTLVASFHPDEIELNATLVDVNADLDVSGSATFRTDGRLYMDERASAGTDFTGFGQLWVKNTTPNELWFTNDAGTDIKIA